MADAALQWNEFGADIVVDNGDLFPDNGLASSVLISLFTDARVSSVEQIPEGETLPRGWWGDLAERTTGSLLWLIARERATQEVAARAKEFCEVALAWIVDDDIAESVEVVPLLVKPSSLQLTIKIKRGNSKMYAYLWEAVAQYAEVSLQNTVFKLQFIE